MDAATQTVADRALLERLRAGDEDAFMDLVDALQPAMLRVARMYVSSQAVAEEVVGDAWLGVLKGLDRFEGRSSLRTWIFRIVTNIAKTRGQREGRSIPEDRLLGAETLRVVRETLDTLPPMQAEVLRLRDVLGWTSEEVRNALDLTETNQRVLLHRARAKVRRALERDFEREANA